MKGTFSSRDRVHHLHRADQQEGEGVVVQEQHEVLGVQPARPPVEEQRDRRHQRQEDEHQLRRGRGELLREARAAVRADLLAGALERHFQVLAAERRRVELAGLAALRQVLDVRRVDAGIDQLLADVLGQFLRGGGDRGVRLFRGRRFRGRRVTRRLDFGRRD